MLGGLAGRTTVSEDFDAEDASITEDFAAHPAPVPTSPSEQRLRRIHRPPDRNAPDVPCRHHGAERNDDLLSLRLKLARRGVRFSPGDRKTMTTFRLVSATVLAAALLLSACAGTPRASVEAAEEPVDSGPDTPGEPAVPDVETAPDPGDAATALAEQLLDSPWPAAFRSEHDRTPVILLERGDSTGFGDLDGDAFARALERRLLEEGTVSLAASGTVRETVRRERMDQQASASIETIARLGEETGADAILFQYVVPSFVDDSVRIDVELVEVESAEKVWIASSPIALQQEIPRDDLALRDPQPSRWRITRRPMPGTEGTVYTASNEAARGSDRLAIIIRHSSPPPQSRQATVVGIVTRTLPPEVEQRRAVVATWRFADGPVQRAIWPLNELRGSSLTVAIPRDQEAFLRDALTAPALYLRAGPTAEAAFDLRGLADALRDAGIEREIRAVGD